MEVQKLTVQPRAETGSRSVRRLRKQGLIPGIVYGHKTEPTPIKVQKDALLQLLRHGLHMVELETDAGNERALIKDIQYDSFGDNVIHVDFTRVAMDEKVTVAIPVELVGSPVGVTHGGILQHLLKEVMVEALPENIPAGIPLTVRDMDVDAVIHVKDLPQMPGVRYQNDPGQMVIHIQPPVKKEEVVEEAVAEAGGAAEPEVLTERESDEKEKKTRKE